jgi:mersacidin/lichenicidin family type 2 lantibiotic
MNTIPEQSTQEGSQTIQIDKSDISSNSNILSAPSKTLGQSKRSRRNLFSKFVSILGASFFIKKEALSAEQIVRAWEDPEFRKSLSAKQWDSLPENPAGSIENAEYSGNLVASGNYCSGNSCSGNSCSGNSCSGNSCSGNSCSGNSCSGNSCSGNSCSGNSCSGNSCSGNSCSGNSCSNNCTVYPNCDDDGNGW